MIDTNKSIEELEDDYRGEPTFGSYVVTTCHRARQKPIKFLSNEEIRCLIVKLSIILDTYISNKSQAAMLRLS